MSNRRRQRAERTTPARALTSVEVAVCVNVGRRLGRGELDASTALRWLQGWVSSTPVAVDLREEVDGDRDGVVE